MRRPRRRDQSSRCRGTDICCSDGPPVGHQAGFTVAEFAAGVGFLVLPVSLLVMSLPGWIETQEAARVAAQQAARAVVTAPDHATGIARGTAVADEVLANRGVAMAGPVAVDGVVAPPAAAGQPQSLVTVTVTVRMPALSLPLVGDWAAWDHAVSHTQPVDVYRSYP